MKPPHTVSDSIYDLSHCEPTKEGEISEYREEWISSDYQRWSRGLLPTEELFSRRKPAWAAT